MFSFLPFRLNNNSTRFLKTAVRNHKSLLFYYPTSWLMQFPPSVARQNFLADSYCYCTFNSFHHAHSNNTTNARFYYIERTPKGPINSIYIDVLLKNTVNKVHINLFQTQSYYSVSIYINTLIKNEEKYDELSFPKG